MIDLSRFRNEPMPGYKGPVRSIEPTRGRGKVDMFCPRCGSTDVCVRDAGDSIYACNSCGRRFRLDPTIDDSKEFYICSREFNNASDRKQSILDYAIYDVAEYDYCDCQEYLYDQASSYYGPEFAEVFDGYYSEGKYPYEDEETVDLLAWDPLATEVNYMIDAGYFGGMKVGEHANIPGTPIRVTRTKNAKAGKGKRWLR